MKVKHRQIDSLVIRRYQPSDLAAVRSLFGSTACNGFPAINAVDRWDWMAEAMLLPFARLYPRYFYVAELQGEVTGYLSGCPDTLALRKKWPARALPSVLRAFIGGGAWRDRRTWMLLSQALRSATRNEFEYPSGFLKAYPASLHINVGHTHQSRGIGQWLLQAFLADMTAEGRAVHARTSRPGPDARHPFFEKAGFQPLYRSPLTMWDHIDERPFELITYGLSLTA